MIKKIIFLASLFLSLAVFAQKPNGKEDAESLSRPKLVVGITIDQMRWDFLYRFYERYGNGGFKRLLTKGFTFENAHIPYTPTVTAAGHACIFTGSVPAINGIIGNEWYDRVNQKVVYCSSDESVMPLGSDHKSAGYQSPRNMWTTSICDEMKMASNFKSKSIGVCIKDRGAIFPAGHSADAAFWYDASSGNWISSSYYMTELPSWLQSMNEEKLPNKYYKKNWNTLYPIETYTLSTADEKIYEGKFKGSFSSSFPYVLDTLVGKQYSTISATPYGNSMTLDVAKAAVFSYELGKDAFTDFLALSFSSTDYVGHQFGPNSIEIEDCYMRLDQELEEFFNFLDQNVGIGMYTIFVSADHGVAHVPGYSKENNLPGGVWSSSKFIIDINDKIEKKFDLKDVVVVEQNYQLYLNKKSLRSTKTKKKEIIEYIVNELLENESVLFAFDLEDLNKLNIQEKLRNDMNNGYQVKRSGDIQIVLKSGYMDTWLTGTTHGSWYTYDTHIPMIFYGWGIRPGKSFKESHMTDIAPTIAALLQIQMPSGCIGKVADEAFDTKMKNR